MMKQIFKFNAGNKKISKKENQDEQMQYIFMAHNLGNALPIIIPIKSNV